MASKLSQVRAECSPRAGEATGPEFTCLLCKADLSKQIGPALLLIDISYFPHCSMAPRAREVGLEVRGMVAALSDTVLQTYVLPKPIPEIVFSKERIRGHRFGC